MSDHSKALVPIETWSFASPELRRAGQQIDIGLFAEGLVYYDQIFITLSTEDQFYYFINWFLRQNKYADLSALVRDGTINFIYYSFSSVGIKDLDGAWSIWNVQDEEAANKRIFEKRFLNNRLLSKYIKEAKYRDKIYNLFKEKIFEEKASEYEQAIANARKDVDETERHLLAVQCFVDEAYPLLNAKPFKITLEKIPINSSKTNWVWNIDFDGLGRDLGKELNFEYGSIYTGIAQSNKFLCTASKKKIDLYLPKPISSLIGNKLYESSLVLDKTNNIIETLENEVNFPNVRNLINSKEINFNEIMLFRKKGKKFREWLQQEGERDRNALLAYHNEVIKEIGWTKFLKKNLKLFGVLAGGGLGGAISSAFCSNAHIGNLLGGTIGGISGSGIEYLFDIATQLKTDWKPVIFGNWAKEYIQNSRIQLSSATGL